MHRLFGGELKRTYHGLRQSCVVPVLLFSSKQCNHGVHVRETLDKLFSLAAKMPVLPTTSLASTRHRQKRTFIQIANSKPGRSLLLALILIPAFYFIYGSFCDTLYGSGSYWPGIEPTEPDAEESSMEPLTSLGLEADRSFHLGGTSKASYKAELEHFIKQAFPKSLQKRATASIRLYLGDSVSPLKLPEIPRNIYQTAKREPYWTDPRLNSWRNLPGYSYYFFDDPKADGWVSRTFKGAEIELVWEKIGLGIKKSDLLRYLLVMTEGGIYTDTDTVRLKPISKWGEGADFEGPEPLSPPSLIVGIEADVGGRKDWHKWWPRPLQIVQWTFASAPMHPILIDTVRRIHHITAAIEANKTNAKSKARRVGDRLESDDSSVSVMEWTGPGVFTDSVIRYLVANHNTTWPALKSLRSPLRIKDTVVLPITGFSPGVRMFGAGDTTDREAMVYHLFAGSWKKHQ